MDRLSFAFPVRAVERSFGAWESVTLNNPGRSTQGRTYRGTVELDEGVSAFVSVKDIVAGRRRETWAKVEGNPSRLVDPGGVGLASPHEARVFSLLAWRATKELMEPAVEVDEAVVKRLDVARDFEGVEAPSFYIRGLAPLRRRHARRTFLYNDPGRGAAETLFVGGKVGGVRLYDKHQESPEKAAHGHLRWEVEARSDWLQRLAGVSRLEHVTDERVVAFARNRWEWSAMGVEVSATDRVVEKVLRSGLSPAKARGFLGHLLMQSRGVSLPLGKQLAADYNRLQRELGIALADLAGEELGFVGRLDWETGREVLRVA